MSVNEKVNDKKGLPLWLIVLLSAFLIVALTFFGLEAYKNPRADTWLSQSEQLKRAELESIKEAIIQKQDAIDTNWLRTLNPIVKQVQGRLLWSSEMQQGVIEFINLPKLKGNQQYLLWVYDLQANNSRPITVATIKSIEAISGIFSYSFQPSTKLLSPLKFELLLEEAGKSGLQPLLLAQP